MLEMSVVEARPESSADFKFSSEVFFKEWRNALTIFDSKDSKFLSTINVSIPLFCMVAA